MSSNLTERYAGKIFAGIVILLVAGIIYSKTDYGFDLTPPGGILNQSASPVASVSAPAAAEVAPSNRTDLSQLVAQAEKEHPAPIDSRTGRYSDPYAAGQLALAQSEYRQSKALLMARTARAAHAAACSVINRVYVSTIELTGMDMIAEQERATGFPGDHPELFPLLRAIEAKVYKAVGAQPAFCEYWRQNPQAVALMREEAALSN